MASSVDIIPSLGHGLVMSQVGPLAGYDAIDVRRAVEGQCGEGVSTSGSFRVSQRAAGANMTVDVNMDDVAWIRGDAVSLQSVYTISPHSATINVDIATADVTNPRIDMVVLEAKDNTHDVGGLNVGRVRVVTGTATGGATLDNRTGAAALPASALLLADVLVVAADTSITDSEIRDRRAFSAPGVIPPLVSGLNMVVPTSPLPTLIWDITNDLVHSSHDLKQAAALVYIPRRIVSATRIRWKYLHGGTAITGNYVIALMDASGRGIVNTGSVAFTGALNTTQVRSETITATTFEPGWYYVLIGLDTTAGAAGTAGWGAIGSISGVVASSPSMPNVSLTSASGGVTVPSTILGFTDACPTPGLTVPKVPQIALSVG